ncbi:MAG TPA: GNAT family N-acetyltransferase, partial [Sphingomonas sp.]|nr:GNAT family N-acetyltransferase [Sphingomonas sp.]
RIRYRRQGLGRALLEQVAADALDQGTRTLHLEVRACNPAIALYRDAGFEQVGIRQAYYRGRRGKVFDALTFKRHLADD